MVCFVSGFSSFWPVAILLFGHTLADLIRVSGHMENDIVCSCMRRVFDFQENIYQGMYQGVQETSNPNIDFIFCSKSTKSHNNASTTAKVPFRTTLNGLFKKRMNVSRHCIAWVGIHPSARLQTILCLCLGLKIIHYRLNSCRLSNQLARTHRSFISRRAHHFIYGS